MADQAKKNWVVLKYGGTSVGEADNWPRIAEVLNARCAEGLRPVFVHSALAGVSDQLDRLAAAAAGQQDYSQLLEWISARHRALADELGLVLPERVAELEQELARLAAGAALIGELSASLKARIMALGELIASEIAVGYLRAADVAVRRVDAREILCATGPAGRHDPRHFLAATCDPVFDQALCTAWGETDEVIVTQGFIARDEQGRTVLLGRGGSDTSAAYLAAKLAAVRLEIWTDVPGMFSANPRLIPAARLLKRLSFEEAQEIAATGAKVLHPRCLPIAHRAGIPVHIYSSHQPDLAGTVISDLTGAGAPRIKAVSARQGLTLVSMESLGMWQEAGFLAQAFQIFAELGLSIDLVSTSESVVSVTLDSSVAQLDETVLEWLERRLGALCRVRIVRPCAAVSLVGARMRANLHKLAPVLESFEEHEIFLVSQAASDLNFTVVIEESQVDRMLRSVHELVIGSAEADEVLGPSWEQLAAPPVAAVTVALPWWERKRAQLLELAQRDGAAYVYDEQSLANAAAGLLGLEAIDRVLFAVKANPNPDVLKCLHRLGVGFECVSPGELQRVLALFPDLPREQVLFTPNFAPRAEYEEAFAAGVTVTLDNLYPLETWPDCFAGRQLFARMDLGEGSGHHKHVRTAGIRSKFGIPAEELGRLEELCRRHDVELIGLHTHSGSGIRDSTHWQRIAVELAQLARRFPTVRVIDLGGGLGVPEKEGDIPLALPELDSGLMEVRRAFPDLQLWLEPGRYLVSEAGVLLVTVTQTKRKGETRYVGVCTGMNSLMRPMLYGAYHRIVNLSKLGQVPSSLVTVVGPICETGDRLGRDRLLPETEEGDVLLIANGGAYGYAMSSHYNLREPAREYLLR